MVAFKKEKVGEIIEVTAEGPIEVTMILICGISIDLTTLEIEIEMIHFHKIDSVTKLNDLAQNVNGKMMINSI